MRYFIGPDGKVYSGAEPRCRLDFETSARFGQEVMENQERLAKMARALDQEQATPPAAKPHSSMQKLRDMDT